MHQPKTVSCCKLVARSQSNLSLLATTGRPTACLTRNKERRGSRLVWINHTTEGLSFSSQPYIEMLALGMVSIMVWYRAWFRSSGVARNLRSGDLIHSRGEPKRGTWAVIVIGGDTNATWDTPTLRLEIGLDATGYQYNDRYGHLFLRTPPVRYWRG